MARLMKRLFWFFSFSVLGAILLSVLVLFYVYYHYARDLPDHGILRDYESAAVTRVHAGDGRLLAEYAAQDRSFIAIEAVPEDLIAAFLAAEDKNFYSHSGIDFLAILRSLFRNVMSIYSDRRLVGGSTITQQVAKNFLVGNAVSYERKIREAILAFRIERALTKDRILELYLNEIYLGYGSYGIASAALNYFNKSVEELGLHEMAYLAALPKGPSNYHPISRYSAAVSRRNWVLGRMYALGYIGRADLFEAESQDLRVYRGASTVYVPAAYFLEETRKEAAESFGADVVNEGGLSVRTTLDTSLQAILVESLRSGLLSYDRRHGYRGPLLRFDGDLLLRLDDDWRDILRSAMIARGGFTVDNPYFWDVGVVLDASRSEALLGVISIDSEGVGAGSFGRMDLRGLLWARESLSGGRLGEEVSSVSDVLRVGDVIYVEPAGDGFGDSYDLHQVPEIEGAGVIIDPHNGRVLAMTGGWDFSGSEFNRATQALRQPGSAFKPFVYLRGLELGLTPISPLLDAPFVLEQPGGKKWRPANFSRRFYGMSPMYLGVEKSRNLMTVRLAHFLGMDGVADVAARFDIQNSMPHQLSMALGAGETSLLRLTTAYAMLVNGGKHIRSTLIDRIQNRYGETIFKHDERVCEPCSPVSDVGAATDSFLLSPVIEVPRLEDRRDSVTTPQAAYQLVTMMERVISHGTGRVIKELDLPLAGKTGTTNDGFDAWFIGFSPDLAVGVWTGFDLPRSLGYQPNTAQETGSSVAAPIFKEVMRRAMADKPRVPFRTPNGISLVLIDDDTGLPATAASQNKTLIAFTSEYATEHFTGGVSQEEHQTGNSGLY